MKFAQTSCCAVENASDHYVLLCAETLATYLTLSELRAAESV
jgi:hypothetical protein